MGLNELLITQTKELDRIFEIESNSVFRKETDS